MVCGFGDQIGYAFGRYGGRPLLAAVTRRILIRAAAASVAPA